MIGKGKVIVFDLGGTLMEYQGMPLSWEDSCFKGFSYAAQQLGLMLSPQQLEGAVCLMREYNPRLYPREKEISPEEIFGNITAMWGVTSPGMVSQCISAFFQGLELKPVVYPDVMPTLEKLLEQAIPVAALTDLPTGMPEAVFCDALEPLLSRLSILVTSQSCGWRKPNPYGLHEISTRLGEKTKDLLFIGDEEKDQITAENAGCAFRMISRKAQPGIPQGLAEVLSGLV